MTEDVLAARIALLEEMLGEAYRARVYMDALKSEDSQYLAALKGYKAAQNVVDEWIAGTRRTCGVAPAPIPMPVTLDGAQ